MIGTQATPAQLFYDFDLDRHVPSNHILREIDCFLDVEDLRKKFSPFYSTMDRPSIDRNI